MKKKWLNKNELKDYLGFSMGKIENMMKYNQIPYYKIGKIVKGKNEIDINGINVRKFTNHINKKRQNKTYLLNYSTVTDFAKFLGWSTFLFNNTAI